VYFIFAPFLVDIYILINIFLSFKFFMDIFPLFNILILKASYDIMVKIFKIFPKSIIKNS